MTEETTPHTSQSDTPRKGTNPLLVPGAIIVAGLLIAGSIVLSESKVEPQNQGDTVAGDTAPAPSFDDFRMPSSDDHIKGNPDGDISIVEYSDYECPFCGQFHPTLERIVEESPDVRWVFRHFPLSSIHARALSASVASECVASLAGNDAFWDFSEALFANQRGLGTELYENTAVSLGINLEDFRACQTDKSMEAEVIADLTEVQSIGGRGTPFVVLITKKGEMVPFSGALPYETVKALVDRARES